MYLPSFRLDGSVAVVTGGSRGIGRALAIGLAEAGADVAIIARAEKELNEAAEEIRQTGRKAYIVTADLIQKTEIDKAIDKLSTETNGISILINNVGINIRTPALEVTDDQWEKIIQTNLKSAFFTSQACAKQMKKKGYGRIVNIASVAGKMATRSGVVYALTKAGMIQMTKVLALEWAQYGINVNGVSPWYVKTPLTEGMLSNESYVSEILGRTMIKRLSEVQDLVGPVVFLCSAAANFITGQTLFVDGGMTVYGF